MTKEQMENIFNERVLFNFVYNWLNKFLNEIINEIPSLQYAINNRKNLQIIDQISKNPSKFDLTYTMWLLIKNNEELYKENLEDFESQNIQEHVENSFPEINIDTH